MNQRRVQAVSIPNPALHPFSILIGTWTTTGTHKLVPDTVLHGRTSFEWLEHGAFLLMRSELDDPRFPRTTAIFSSDDSEKVYSMHTFDARGVSRTYNVRLHETSWHWWRHAAGFFQRYEGRIVDGGTKIISTGELSHDGLSWEQDLDLIYTRVT